METSAGVDSQGMESLDAEVFTYNWIPSQILSTENLKVVDFVLLIEPDATRPEWKIGRIEAVYPGQDGLVRVVDVRTGGSVERRPITRLSPLGTEVLLLNKRSCDASHLCFLIDSEQFYKIF